MMRKLLVVVALTALIPWCTIAGTASAASGCEAAPGVVQVHWLSSGIHYQPSAIDEDGRLSTVELLGHEGTPKLVSVWECTDGSGAWAVTPEGHVYIGGAAQHFGHALGTALNAPIVSMAMTPTGLGYWLVASDGGIFAYGDARYFGSTGAMKLNAPIVAMASTPTGKGYWLAASDGGLFTFGDADYLGSMGGTPLNQPIVGMVATSTGDGYWMVARDGGIFTFGDAEYLGSNGGESLSAPMAGMIPHGDGYSLVDLEGTVTSFGSNGTTTTTGGDHDHHGTDGTDDGSTVDPTGPIISVDDPRLTEAQRAAAVKLIDDTTDGMAKYPDEAAVKAAGFLSIGDAATGFEHYVNWSYLLDSHEMDPNHIESVVLRVDDDGTKTVESAMYILSVGKTMNDVPDIAGELTTFHKHDDLCFSGTRVVALAGDDGDCPAGSLLLVTPPMLHVWLTPQECGPFAGIETGNHGTSCHVH